MPTPTTNSSATAKVSDLIMGLIDSAEKTLGRALDEEEIASLTDSLISDIGEGGVEEEGAATENARLNGQAHSASQDAASASVHSDHVKARDHALAALDHSREGNSEEASEMHVKAAAQHERAATQCRKDGDMLGAEQHDHAGAMHRKAASEHAATMNSDNRDSVTPDKKEQEEDQTMNREATIDWLTTNCACWKGGDEDREVLGNLSDEKLQTLQENAEQAQMNAVVANVAATGFADGRGSAYRVNPETGAWEYRLTENAKKKTDQEMADEEDVEDGGADEEEEDAQGKKVTKNARVTPTPTPTPIPAPSVARVENNKKASTKPMTMQEMLKHATPEDRAVWNHSVAIIRQAKADIIERIVTANSHTEEGQAALRPIYDKLDLDTLKVIANALPEPEGMAGAGLNLGQGNYGQGYPSYLGAASPAVNRGKDDEDDYLPIPTVNWKERVETNHRVRSRVAAANEDEE